MTTVASHATRLREDELEDGRGRLPGLDLARALAMLGMLVVHTIGTHNTVPDAVLWTAYGWAAPLFVVLAGAGLSLATRPTTPTGRGQPRARSMVVARAVILLLIGLAISPLGEGNILHYFGLYFLVGVCAVRSSRFVLSALAGLCLVAGPLAITLLFHVGAIDTSVSRADIGLGALGHPMALLRALTLDGAYPAIVWFGFFLIGMVLGRLDLTSATLAKHLFWRGAGVATVVFAVGWAGARRYGSAPLGWTHHWTTYGHTEALAWTLASAALVLAIIGGTLWITLRWGERARRQPRLVAPVLALGQMSLTFYLVHLAYAGTVWKRLDPHLTSTPTYVLATLAFWLAFAVVAQQWLRRLRRGPVESVVHWIASLAIRPPTTEAPR